jgi:hypothetical protein
MQRKINFFSPSHNVHNKVSLKISFLYSTLEELVKNESPLLSGVNLKHIDNINKSVIYVGLKAKPTYHIYDQEYEFNERHLTIHKFYNERNKTFRNGLSITQKLTITIKITNKL